MATVILFGRFTSFDFFPRLADYNLADQSRLSTSHANIHTSLAEFNLPIRQIKFSTNISCHTIFKTLDFHRSSTHMYIQCISISLTLVNILQGTLKLGPISRWPANLVVCFFPVFLMNLASCMASLRVHTSHISHTHHTSYTHICTCIYITHTHTCNRMHTEFLSIISQQYTYIHMYMYICSRPAYKK